MTLILKKTDLLFWTVWKEMIVFSVQNKYVTYFSGKKDIWLIFCEKYVFQEREVEKGGWFLGGSTDYYTFWRFFLWFHTHMAWLSLQGHPPFHPPFLKSVFFKNMGHELSPEQKIILLGCQVAEIDQQTFRGKKEPFFTRSSYFRDLEIV